MTLSQDDKERIELIVAKLAGDLVEKLLLAHVNGCPHGKAFAKFKAYLLGLAIGWAVAGGIGGYMLGKAFP